VSAAGTVVNCPNPTGSVMSGNQKSFCAISLAVYAVRVQENGSIGRGRRTSQHVPEPKVIWTESAVPGSKLWKTSRKWLLTYSFT
jgi:hypothetical protein